MLIGAGCTATSEADIEALVDERVEVALEQAATTTTETTEGEPGPLSVHRVRECLQLENRWIERSDTAAVLGQQALAAMATDDLAEARRSYRLQITAFDEMAAFEARLVERCEELALSDPELASFWYEDRRAFAGLAESYRQIRAECREVHDLLGMDIEDC